MKYTLSNPALLHRCPSGQHSTFPEFRLVSKNGKSYKPITYTDGGWSAQLPAGTYHAAVVGCPAEDPFVIKPGRTLTGVAVLQDCGIG